MRLHDPLGVRPNFVLELRTFLGNFVPLASLKAIFSLKGDCYFLRLFLEVLGKDPLKQG